MDAISFVHEQLTTKANHPNFKAGDNVTVNYRIIEGVKERIQSFKGDVIKRQGEGSTATFTVRKISDSIGVERLFPINSPNIESIVLNKVGRVEEQNFISYVKEVVRVLVLKRKEWLWVQKRNNFCTIKYILKAKSTIDFAFLF